MSIKILVSSYFLVLLHKFCIIHDFFLFVGSMSRIRLSASVIETSS